MLFPLLLNHNISRTLTTGLLCLSAVTNISQPIRASFGTRCPAVIMSQPANSEWLQEQLSTLLASPHIHFNSPKLPGLHLRMGPGPVDVFSTRFSNMFTKEATGVVGGKEVDKEGLKQSLLAMQKQWNPDTAKFVAMDPQGEEHQVRCRSTEDCEAIY